MADFDDIKSIMNDENEENKNTETKKTNWIKRIGFFFLLLFFLFLEMDRENGHLKHVPYFGTAQIMYNLDEKYGFLTMEGSWDKSNYPNHVYITCQKYEKECIVEVADIPFNVLDITKEYFTITKWDKNFVEAEYKNAFYLFTLVINKNTKELTRSRYPLKKETVIGYIPSELHTKLISGVTAYTNTLNYEFDKLSFWNNPLIKIIDFCLKNREKEKND